MTGRMSTDKLQQFKAVQSELRSERADLLKRIAQIDEALGLSGGVVKSAAAAPAKTKRMGRPRGGGGKRAKNDMSLKAAVTKVTSRKALTKAEILSEIDKLGYKFTAKNPENSLNTVLYAKGLFKNTGGKFSPAKPKKG